ncbi:hypothetical protein Aduo_001067 [Ancylostoma duodenale]
MPEERKTVTIKLKRERTPEMTIRYKDKKDLFEQFQKNLKRFGFPTDEVYWYDWENVHTRMRTSEDVYIAVKDDGFAKMFVRDPHNRETFPSFSSDVEEETNEELAKMSMSKNRSPSPVCGRGRSQSEPRHGSLHNAENSYYPTPWNYSPWMNPRYGVTSFPCDPQAYGMDSRSRRQARHHCHCKNRHEGLEKL